MKILFTFFVLLSVLYAQDRPKIALVLSGGGARGGAHVGVLKELEKYRVPVDMIIGTSMGSFVGGLYVSGKTPQEIETMLTTTDWKKYIRTNYDRQDMPMRKKDLDYTYQGRLGIGINADGEVVLPTGVFRRQPMLLKFEELTENVRDITNFDNLSIPFRAIATDIKNGDQVVLSGGSLAESIYASSSVPGGFQPIHINGFDLVDGGVSDNIPIQVARDMGADIIIAVDVSENFSENLDVNSYFVVMGQLVNILMRKNANESIATLDDKDVLLTPPLDGYTGLDADKYAEIIATGVKVAKEHKSELEKFSITKEEYAVYRKKHRKKHQFLAPIIDEIRVENPTYLSNQSILNRIHQKEGMALDLTVLREDLLHLYNMTIFDSVSYSLKTVDSKKILTIITTPSWDNQGEVRFALGLEDDFKGHSAYSLKLGYTMFGLNPLGGEWRNDFEIGRYKKAYSEWFQPFDTMQRYYMRPSISYANVTDVFPLNNLGNYEVYSSRLGSSFVLGAHVTTNYEFEIGASYFNDEIEIDVMNRSESYDTRPIFVLINTDDLDNVNFPKVGTKASIRWSKEMKAWGSDYDYEQFYVDIEKPFTIYSHNVTAYLKYGNTYKNNDSGDVIRMSGLFTLGGLFNLSGYSPYSFYGDSVALGVLRYSYEIKDGGFFGTLNAPLYAGFSLEMGDAWDNGIDIDLKKSATVYVAADTFLGPLYIATGYSIDGELSGYLYLGEKF